MTPTRFASLAATALAVHAGAFSGAALAQARTGLPGPIPTPLGARAALPQPIPPGPRGTLLGRTGTLLPPSQGSMPRPTPLPHPTPHDGGGFTTGGSHFRPIDVPPGGFVGSGLDQSFVGGSVSGSGVTIDGNFVGDHSRVAFHVGSPAVLPNGRLARFVGHRDFHWHHHHHPWWWWGSGYYWPYYGYAYDYWDYNGSPVYGTGSPYVDPYVTQGQTPGTQQAPEPPRILSSIEKAQLALQSDDPKNAIIFFREHLAAHPDDTASMRLLAIALMDDKRLDEATAVMAMAYDKEPTLARTPLDSAILGDGMDGLRRRVISAVTYANRVNTSAAWTLAATLMQAEGRDGVAKQTIAKAKAKGLSPRVASEFESALGKV